MSSIGRSEAFGVQFSFAGSYPFQSPNHAVIHIHTSSQSPLLIVVRSLYSPQWWSFMQMKWEGTVVQLYGRGRSTVTGRPRENVCDRFIGESIMSPTLRGLCSPARGTWSCAGRRGLEDYWRWSCWMQWSAVANRSPEKEGKNEMAENVALRLSLIVKI